MKKLLFIVIGLLLIAVTIIIIIICKFVNNKKIVIGEDKMVSLVLCSGKSHETIVINVDEEGKVDVYMGSLFDVKEGKILMWGIDTRQRKTLNENDFNEIKQCIENIDFQQPNPLKTFVAGAAEMWLIIYDTTYKGFNYKTDNANIDYLIDKLQELSPVRIQDITSFY